MFVESHSQFDEAQFEARALSCLGGIDVGNGSPVAHALASALMLDHRMSGRQLAGIERLKGLSREETVDLAANLIWAVSTPRAKFELPLGTRVVSRGVGHLQIGDEVWLLDADRTGLHPLETTDRGARGRNLLLLRSHIERLTRRRACRHVGLPSPALIVNADARHVLQFPPLAEAGGVVLQRRANGTDAPRFCAALPSLILEFAESVVEDMAVLWKHRKEIGARAIEVRRRAEAFARENGVTVKAVVACLGDRRDIDGYDMYVEYVALDEALRPGVVAEFIPAHDELAPHTRLGLWGLDARRGEAERLRALGADGRIDEMAASLAAASPQGTAAVLATLANSHECTFTMPTSGAPLYATLFWKNGLIEAEASMAGRIDYAGDCLTVLDHALPATIASALAGRPLNSVLELPFDCRCTILEANASDKQVAFKLDVDESLVHCATGAIWDEPANEG